MKHEMIKPIRDRVLIKPTSKEEMTKGGLFIPEIAQEQTLCGTVVAIGSGEVSYNEFKSAMTVKPGDRVYFTKNATNEVMHNGSEHLIMKENRILLIAK